MDRTVPAVSSRVRSLSLRLALLAAAGASSISGCNRDEVTHVRVPKGGDAPEAPAPPPGMQGEVPPPPRPAGSGGLKWTLPKGWTEATAGGCATPR